MSPDARQHELSRVAAVSGRGAYPEPGPQGPGPDFAESRFLTAAQWVALAGAVAIFLGGVLAAVAVSSSRDWVAKTTSRNPLVQSSSSGGGLIIIGGGLVALLAAIAIYAVARALPSHPRAGVIVFFVAGACAVVFGAVLLAAPELLIGQGGNAAGRAASGLSDAQLAGLALLLAGALAGAAGALTLAAVARVRRPA